MSPIAEYDLGTARGRIEIDGSGAQKGIDQATKASDKMAGGMERHAGTLLKVGGALTGVGVAAAAGFGIAVNAAATFEKELSAFKAVTGVTTEQLEQIRQKALQIGRDTSFGAAQAAGALTELGKAGLSTEDILGGAADATIALAEAGEIDVAQAAKIAAAALNQFQLEAEDLPGVADLLAGAANASATGVSELGLAFEYVGPIARAAGVSIEDTAGTLALLSNNGIDANKAGTALRSILVSLQPTSDRAKEAMRELGLMTEDGTNAFYNADGSLKDMRDIVGLLNKSMGGLTEAQKTAYGEAIFGREALSAVSAIAATTTEDFDKLNSSIGDISAADVAKERLNNLSGSFTILKGTIETALISAGSPVQSVLKGIVDQVTKLINWFAQLSPETQKMITIFVLATAALATFAGIILMAIGVFLKVRRTIIAFRIAMQALNLAFLTNPVFLIIAAIAALIAIFVVAYKKSETFRNFIDGLWQSLQKAVDWIIEVGKAVGKWLVDAFDKVSDTLEPVIDFFQTIIDTVKSFIYTLTSGFTVEDWATPVERFALILRGLIPIFQNVLRIIKAFVSIVIGIFTGDWRRVWEGVKQIFNAAWDNIKMVLGAILPFFGRILASILTTVAGWGTSLLGKMVSLGTDILKAVLKWLMDLPKNFAYGLGLVLGTIVKWSIQVVAKAVELGTEFRDSLMEFFKQLPGLIWGFLVAAIKQIIEWNRQALQWAARTGTDFLAKIVQFFRQLPGRIWSFLVNAIQRIGQFQRDAVAWAVRTGTDFVGKIIGFVQGLPSALWNLLTQAIARAKDFARDAHAEASHMASGFVSRIIDEITKLPGRVGDILGRIIGAIKGRIRDAFNAVKDFASNLWKGFKEGLGISSPSFIEEAMFALTKNVGQELKTLQHQMRDVNALGRSLPTSPLAGTGTTGAVSPIPAQAQLPQNVPQVPIRQGDTISINALPEKSAREIAEEIFIEKRILVG